MKLSQFKFKLPDEQIALEPPFHRDECKLMVLHRKSQRIESGLDFRNILDYFDEDDAFIFNDTKVFPARLYGTKEKTDAKIEVFLLRELNADQRLWDVLVEPARKIRIGNKLFFEDDGPIVAEVIDNTTSRGRTLRFLYDCPHDEFKRELYALGAAPLPRYIIDKREATEEDMDNFQTIYAKNEGAVTAPATGLHFSRELMKRMEIKGINFAFITLHCGLGNFDAIEVEDLTKHKMSSEQMFIPREACDVVNKAKEEVKRRELLEQARVFTRTDPEQYSEEVLIALLAAAIAYADQQFTLRNRFILYRMLLSFLDHSLAIPQHAMALALNMHPVTYRVCNKRLKDRLSEFILMQEAGETLKLDSAHQLMRERIMESFNRLYGLLLEYYEETLALLPSALEIQSLRLKSIRSEGQMMHEKYYYGRVQSIDVRHLYDALKSYSTS